MVVLDPGHGGIDPGAERDGIVESDLMLTFARELREVLLRSGWVQGDPDPRRRSVCITLKNVSALRAVPRPMCFCHYMRMRWRRGGQPGPRFYTLSDEASDIASEKLAERHDRGDLLAGVDLHDHDDDVALLLMDLARTDNKPRSNALADALVEGIHSATGSIYKTPRLQAGFSVLKAPDIPSVLIELGFMSSPKDLEKMISPDWRKDAATGIRDALQYWAIQDAAQADLLRK